MIFGCDVCRHPLYRVRHPSDRAGGDALEDSSPIVHASVSSAGRKNTKSLHSHAYVCFHRWRMQKVRSAIVEHNDAFFDTDATNPCSEAAWAVSDQLWGQLPAEDKFAFHDLANLENASLETIAAERTFREELAAVDLADPVQTFGGRSSFG